MIKKFFAWLKQPLGLIAVGIVFLALFSAAVYGIYTTQQSPEQPIQFPHKTHVAFGIQCLSAIRGQIKDLLQDSPPRRNAGGATTRS